MNTINRLIGAHPGEISGREIAAEALVALMVCVVFALAWVVAA